MNQMKRKIIFLTLFTILAGVSLGETISEIQGDNMYSTMENKKVTKVEGVVTAVKKSKDNNGFFIQSRKPDKDDRTSEGIYIENKTDVEVKRGDLVRLEGEVKEIYFGKIDKSQPATTSIQADKIKVLKENVKVTPVILTGKEIPKTVRNGNNPVLDIKNNAMDYYESLEGTLVKIKDPVITGFKEKYGDITVVPSNGMYAETRSINGGVVYNNYEKEQTQRITINTTSWNLVENGKFKNNLTPNPGDKFNGDIEGVIYFENSEYRLYPVSAFPGITDGKTARETNKYKYDKEMLNVVSYNIENFSHVDGPERVKELANQVATVLQTPDILGLIEVGDDDGQKKSEVVTAKNNVEAIVNAIKEKTGIDYGYMTVNPTDGKDGGWPEMHIRNVILYRKDRVKPVKFNQGNSQKDTEVVKKGNKVQLTYNPGRIGNNDEIWTDVRKPVIAQFEFKGQNLFVLANHLKSKRFDEKIYGTSHPVIRKSEEVRNPQGKQINNFIKSILNNDPKATVIVLGDMNDFEFSQTIKNINGDELIDTISELPVNERYSYVYQGASQTLDNIMINKKYKGQVNVDVIRINSEFTIDQGSFSDHDPVFVQFKIQ